MVRFFLAVIMLLNSVSFVSAGPRESLNKMAEFERYENSFARADKILAKSKTSCTPYYLVMLGASVYGYYESKGNIGRYKDKAGIAYQKYQNTTAYKDWGLRMNRYADFKGAEEDYKYYEGLTKIFEATTYALIGLTYLSVRHDIIRFQIRREGGINIGVQKSF